MIQLFKEQPGVIVFAILQYLAISLSGSAAIFVVPALALAGYMGTRQLFYPFISLMILLPLADSAFPFASSAYQTRPVLMVLLTMLVFLNHNITPKTHWSFKAFIPYFLVIAYYLLSVANNTEIFKSISYFLVILVSPVIIRHMILYEKELFLRGVVLIYTMVYVLSFMNIETDSTLESYGRFSGIFNNPNALGIFSFLFFMLTHIIFRFQPQLFSKPERFIVTALIIVGVLYSRSRSGMFAIAIYWGALYVYQRWHTPGLITAAISLFLINMVISYEDIIRGLGLADFFRLESLETGSGRKIAMEEAWLQILQNPVSGYGIGYTEDFFTEQGEELAKKGHVGSVHNSFLWVWLDTGLFGLLTYLWGWGKWFFNTYKYSFLAIPIGVAVLFSTNVESWLMGSLNHVTIQFIILLTLLSSDSFISEEGIKTV
jgi:hypothetical protein